MRRFRFEPAADAALDEIYQCTLVHWGEVQAEAYIRGLFAHCAAMADHTILWRRIPATFGIDGYFCRYERHFLYWKEPPDGTIAIALILHERMQQMNLLHEAFGN